MLPLARVSITAVAMLAYILLRCVFGKAGHYRYRARLVVKGYAQKKGIDFNEIFSPVVRLTTIRVVMSMCITFDIHLEQLDVKTTFFHRELEDEIYMLQLKGFEEKGKENLVCRLNKSLYGLKKVPRY